jgi:hypothetical protein
MTYSSRTALISEGFGSGAPCGNASSLDLLGDDVVAEADALVADVDRWGFFTSFCLPAAMSFFDHLFCEVFPQKEH